MWVKTLKLLLLAAGAVYCVRRLSSASGNPGRIDLGDVKHSSPSQGQEDGLRETRPSRPNRCEHHI